MIEIRQLKLFVGIDCDRSGGLISLTEELTRLAGSGVLRGLRVVPSENLHVTLKFLGMTREERLEEVVAVVRRVATAHRPMALALGGVGCFSEALWVGVSPNESLQALQQALDSALTGIGFEPESRAFLPHVTVARLSRGAGPALADLSATYGDRDWGRLTAESIHVYESLTSSTGSEYRRRLTAALGQEFPQ